jgi:hypothetical protein
MTKRTPPTYPAGWHVADETTLNGHAVTPGTELSIRGERGRFRFLRHITVDGGADWLDVYGGPKGAEQLRSFYPERVKTVHRLKTTDKALLAARKASK